MQQTLFDLVLGAYGDGETSNENMYKHVTARTGDRLSDHVEPVGESQTPTNVLTRKLRWAQQSLKREGLIENIGHGCWRLTNQGKYRLTAITMDKYMVAAHTDLGCIVWGNSANVFDKVITEDVHLVLTSPPYLNVERSYGTTKDENTYIDFILAVLTPLRRRMVKGANLALNVTQDAFLNGTHGARSLYLEKLTLRLAEELDLYLMDRLVWHANNKAPGPCEYVAKRRTHLNAKYEPVLHFCTSPEHCLADNRRVLQPYSKSMKKLIAQGGEQTARHGGDSKHQVKVGSYGKDNGGSIAGNVISIGTTCPDKRNVIKQLKAQGLPAHSATFPLKLVRFLLQYLCPPGGHVVDPFGGLSSTGCEAQKLGLNWTTCELHWEYIKASLCRFEHAQGYFVNPLFSALDDPMVRYKFAAA